MDGREEVREVKGQEAIVYNDRRGAIQGVAQVWVQRRVWVDAVTVNVLGIEEF